MFGLDYSTISCRRHAIEYQFVSHDRVDIETHCVFYPRNGCQPGVGDCGS